MITPLFKPESIHPLRGVEPDLAPDDLAMLQSISTGAKIVALGEPTHGQKEINQLRDRMTRYLVEHVGFRVVAMEDSAIRCRVVNDFIVNDIGSAENALRQQNFWTWKTREVLAMIVWLREWNVAHPDDTVRFIGVDIQDFASPVAQLFTVLAGIDIEIVQTYSSRLTRIGNLNVWVTEGFSDADYELDMNTLQELREVIMASTDDPGDLELSQDCLLQIEQALRLRRAVAKSPDERSPERWNRRDDVMATRTLAPALTGEKVVLWAHDAHVQSEPMDGLPPGAVTMGQVLREHLSLEYAVISGVFGSGSYQGFNDATGMLDTLDVGAPPDGSLDLELWDNSNSPALLVNLDATGSSLFEEQITRWAGALLILTELMIAKVRPAIGSNAIAFVRECTPSEPI